MLFFAVVAGIIPLLSAIDLLPSPIEPDKVKPQARIIGGEEAEFGRYPYHVDLETVTGFHACGASLIAPNVVLTAAHCNVESIQYVNVGRHDKENPNGDFDSIQIVEKIPHPLYDDDLFYFDYMLMILDSESDNEYLRINRDPTVPNDNQELTLIGFGDIDPSETSDVLPTVPHEVTVNSIPNELCETAKSSFFERYRGRIIESSLCAADEGEDSCQGDSGGPLILKGATPAQDVQVGVVSWGFGCADPRFPGVNARVSHEIDWIATVVCEKASSPPPEFDCQNLSPANPTGPTLPPIPIDPIELKVEIKLDAFAYETGWKLEHIVGLETETVAMVPYSTYDTAGSVERTFALEKDGLYNFLLADLLSDGINNGYVRLTLGGEKTVLDVAGNEFNNGFRQFFYATTGELPPGSIFVDQDFPGNAFLTFQIEMDNFPYEIGFEVKSNIDGSTIFYRPPGFYQDSQVVTETFSLPVGPKEYTLSVADTNGDGLENTAGYALFEGSPSEGKLLVRSSFSSGFREDRLFSVVGNDPSSASLSIAGSVAIMVASLSFGTIFSM